MAIGRSVVINGDLGSGKSTVSILLAQQLHSRRISVGHLYRDLAQQRGMTALELNLHAELDDEIDHHIDRLQKDIAASGETVVVDSRLAWFFFRDALKVHLIADPLVAAHRVLDRPADTVESYASVVDAQTRLAERSASERVRFIKRYGADKARLRNYDLVCDSTRATPEEIVARIVEALETPAVGLRLLIDPHRIHATDEQGGCDGAIRLGYARPHFFAIDGKRAVVAAIRDGRTLVSAALVAEADELIGERTAEAYFAAQCCPNRLAPISELKRYGSD
jgi:cytidylate kinase